jgi:hypothetical protein
MERLIFISHITEETEVATALKKLIEDHFPQPLNIFVSSDGESIKMGRDWLNTVLKALRTCPVQIIICSSKSVTREWVNLEVGAALSRDIPIIPACHSGMTPSKLPIPLLLRQTARLTDIDGMKKIVGDLAEVLGVSAPDIDFATFVAGIKAFEDRYTFWDECNSAFGIIGSVHPKIIPLLRSNFRLDMDLPENSINSIERVLPFLRSNELLNFRRIGRSSVMSGGGVDGVFNGCELFKLSKLDAIMASPHFKPTAKQPANAQENALPSWIVKPSRQ